MPGNWSRPWGCRRSSGDSNLRGALLHGRIGEPFGGVIQRPRSRWTLGRQRAILATMPEAKSLNLRAAPWRVGSLAALKRDRRLHLPDLQRGFVWSADRVLALLDSLYRSYPVGALLLWEPTWEVEAPFSTRAWDICPPDEVTARGVPE